MSIRSWILLAAMVAAAACSGGSGDLGQGPGDTPEGDVQVRNNSFTPSSLQVGAGATVEWAWASEGETHNVTFDDGEHSDNRSSGTYARTFGSTGSYRYHCTIHGTATGGMRGVVTVGSAPPPPPPGDGGDDPYDY
jgi:plastocyanin